MAARIAVFTGDLSHSVRKGIVAIDRDTDDASWLIVVHAPRKPLAKLLRSQFLNLRRNGWRWIPHQSADAWNRVRRRLVREPRPSSWPDQFDLERMGDTRRIDILRVADIHAPDTLAAVADFGPDIGLSLAAPILRRALFSPAAARHPEPA